MHYLRKFLRTYQGFVAPIILGPLSLILIIFGIYPASTTTYGLFYDVRAQQEAVSELRQKIATLESMDEQSLETQLALATSSVPTDKSVPTLFSTVETLSANSGTTLVDLTLSSPGSLATESAGRHTEDKTFGAFLMPFSVQVIGPYEQAQAFLDNAVDVRRLLRVRTFSLNFAGEETRMQVQLDTLYSPLPTTLGRVDARIEPLTEKDEAVLSRLNNQQNYSRLLLEAFAPTIGESLKADPFAP